MPRCVPCFFVLNAYTMIELTIARTLVRKYTSALEQSINSSDSSGQRRQTECCDGREASSMLVPGLDIWTSRELHESIKKTGEHQRTRFSPHTPPCNLPVWPLQLRQASPLMLHSPLTITSDFPCEDVHVRGGKVHHLERDLRTCRMYNGLDDTDKSKRPV